MEDINRKKYVENQKNKSIDRKEKESNVHYETNNTSLIYKDNNQGRNCNSMFKKRQDTYYAF